MMKYPDWYFSQDVNVRRVLNYYPFSELTKIAEEARRRGYSRFRRSFRVSVRIKSIDLRNHEKVVKILNSRADNLLQDNKELRSDLLIVRRALAEKIGALDALSRENAKRAG